MSFSQKRIGEYTLQEKVGKGGQASVWRAISSDGQTVAIKKMSVSNSIENKKSFDREVAIRKLVQHEFLIKCLNCFQEGDYYYLVYEYCPIDMLRLLQKQQTKKFPENAVRRWTRQLVQVMINLNNLNIIHRDLKPENIMLKEESLDSDIRLTDFGLAREGLAAPSFVGTLEYASPEIKNCQLYSFNTDVWSLGVIVYASLFGRLPVLNGEILQFPVGIEISRSARDFIVNCMIFDHQKRPNFSELIDHEFIYEAKIYPQLDDYPIIRPVEILEHKNQDIEPEILHQPSKYKSPQEIEDYINKYFSLSDGLITITGNDVNMEFLKYFISKYFSDKFAKVLNEIIVGDSFSLLSPEFFERYFMQSENVCTLTAQLELKYGKCSKEDLQAYYFQTDEFINLIMNRIYDSHLKVLVKLRQKIKFDAGID
ncbi:hypothetical protein SteCoe_24910 [Stentor coeruleus]|uniref:Protein kinase domain-containing protein n=1 Tax=Stentor coeruleus TaxID=5963 RepID=A0A1R2BGH5_9CILI|nr:hypothetical protein SteCoe_24910 [Stentor coeruleus]